MSDSDIGVDLGTCCMCGGNRNVGTVVMLHVKNKVPGHGWGCLVCGLASDGAAAVLCNACVDAYRKGERLRFACRGYPGSDGRAPIEEFTEPHEHDERINH